MVGKGKDCVIHLSAANGTHFGTQSSLSDVEKINEIFGNRLSVQTVWTSKQIQIAQEGRRRGQEDCGRGTRCESTPGLQDLLDSTETPLTLFFFFIRVRPGMIMG